MTGRVLSLALLTVCSLGCGSRSPAPIEIHKAALVVDLHCDTVLRMRDGFDFGSRDTTGHLDLPRMTEGGLDLQVFACWLPTETPKDRCRSEAETLIDTLRSVLDREQERIVISTTAKEAAEAISKGRIAAVISVENGVALADTLENLDRLYERGVRCLTLTHTASSSWCISSADTLPAFDGLTDFGVRVVGRMNDLGMIIDVSHAHPRVVDKVLQLSRDPVIASHSCVAAICQHDRNLTDSQIRAIAAKGGVIGINFYNGYLSNRWGELGDSLWAERASEVDSISFLYRDEEDRRKEEIRRIKKEVRRELGSRVNVDVGTVADHIDHIVALVGSDHVGLGSDFDGIPSLPKGLEDCSCLPNLTQELARRGYESREIASILGGNFMRVFEQVCDQ